MKIDPGKFRVGPGRAVRLRDWPTAIKPLCASSEAYDEALREHVAQLSELQTLLYAHDRYALLLIFQAMDAAGKDSAIKHVMSGVNPQGCQVFSFKHPSAEELDHDFLWRSARALPERGRIGIFNRSYYEEVLIVRVHPDVLSAEKLPGAEASRRDIWEERFTSIRNFEAHLHRNGTRVVKFFLHVSKEEQRRRFLRRLEQPQKFWKFSVDDIAERRFWSDYMAAYEACLGATSTRHAPWYVVPADDKHDARLIVSRIVVDTLRQLRMRFPSPARATDLAAMRRRLERERG